MSVTPYGKNLLKKNFSYTKKKIIYCVFFSEKFLKFLLFIKSSELSSIEELITLKVKNLGMTMHLNSEIRP